MGIQNIWIFSRLSSTLIPMTCQNSLDGFLLQFAFGYLPNSLIMQTLFSVWSVWPTRNYEISNPKGLSNHKNQPPEVFSVGLLGPGATSGDSAGSVLSEFVLSLLLSDDVDCRWPVFRAAAPLVRFVAAVVVEPFVVELPRFWESWDAVDLSITLEAEQGATVLLIKVGPVGALLSLKRGLFTGGFKKNIYFVQLLCFFCFDLVFLSRWK